MKVVNQLGLFFVVVCQLAHAAEDTQLLDEVVVSGSRTAEKLSKTPMAIGVVDDKAIKRDKPKTMGDVINRIPGVNWVDLGNEQHSMGIRQPNGFSAVYQYMEDGIPIRPLGVFNHNSLNELNLSGSERVEVIKGASSSLYGSNAIGGAVNFITARPSLSPYASVGVRNDYKDGYNRLDTGASNTWGDFGLRFSHYSSLRSTNNWQDYSNGKKDSVTVRGDYALSGSSLLHAVLTHNDLDTATTGSLGPTDYLTRPGFSYNTFTWRKDKSSRLTAGWEGEKLQNGLTNVTLFGRKNDHGQLPNYTIRSCAIDATCPTGYRGTINNNHVSSLGFDAKHQQEFTWLTSRLIAGLYYDQSPNTFKSDNLDVTRDPSSLIYTGYAANTTHAIGVRDYKTDINNTALYTQWESTPLEKVRLVIGGRADRIQYDFTNFLTPGADYGAPSESRSFSHFSPKIGSTYAVNEQTSVYANISEGFRPPEVSELYGRRAIPDLKPSTYTNYEVGLRMALGHGIKLDSAIYRLDGKDTIVSYSLAPGNSENRNAGRTRSTGLEVGLIWDKDDTLDARLGLNLVSHRFVQYQVSSTLDYSGKDMPAAPDTLTAEVGYKPIADARVAVEVAHQGASWMNDANTVRYDGHTLLNVRGNYKFSKGWEAWVQGRNLTNRLYANSFHSSYDGTGAYTPNTQDTYSVGAPRSLMVGVNYVFGEKK